MTTKFHVDSEQLQKKFVSMPLTQWPTMDDYGIGFDSDYSEVTAFYNAYLIARLKRTLKFKAMGYNDVQALDLCEYGYILPHHRDDDYDDDF